MKKLLFVLIILTACKKDEKVEPQPAKVYWGNAIYNWGVIVRDQSTYQSYNDTLKTNACLCLVPTINDYKPYTETYVGSEVNFLPVGDIINGHFEYYYLYNIYNIVKGQFTSTTTAKILGSSNDSIILTRGSMVLNMDNSVDLEWNDSIIGRGSNHYKCRYFKHRN